MQTTAKKKYFAALTGATILSLFLVGSVCGRASAQNAGGSTGTVSDAPPNMVRSDGGGAYIEGVSCANVAIFSAGFWQLRTVTNSGVCNGEASYWTPGATVFHRWLTLDFSSPVAPTSSTTPGDLDGNGAAQTQEYAPCRFVFNDGYVRRATSTPVHIYVLKVLASGATTQDTAWAVEYRSPAQIAINADGSRTFSSTAAPVADVYSVAVINHKEQRNYVGTYNLPFSVVAK
jgi:hypothetical protein